MAASDSQLSVSMLAGLTTNKELLMLALDVLMEAEKLVSSTGAGVVLAVLPVELVCVYGHVTNFKKKHLSIF